MTAQTFETDFWKDNELRKTWEQIVPGEPRKTIPYTLTLEAIQKYCRVVGDTHDFAMPHDFMTWKATCHHTHNLLEDGKRFVELYKTQYLYMMYVWGHSFEFRTEEDWALMEQFCQLAGGREDTWYATNIEIVDYMADAARLQYTAAGDKVCNPNAQSIWVEVDGRHYEIPAGKTVALV